jgi:Xaa-Pro aminopeptidase
MKVGKLAFESQHVSVATHEVWSKQLKNVELAPTSDMVEQLRMIKDKEEVQTICDAVACAQRAFEVIRASLRPEQTEKQVADQIEMQVRLFGGDCTSFPPIVAVGPRAALPHARPGKPKIGDDEFVLVDWGARYRGYASDLTRILVTGKISPKLQKVYGVVAKAQSLAIAAIRHGASMKDVDAAARNSIAQAGFGKQFGHGLGHGIGLAIHESPRMGPKEDAPLKAGMVVTVEPGVYIPGWGGVRIEDDVLVTRTGAKVLSNTTKVLEECIVGG